MTEENKEEGQATESSENQDIQELFESTEFELSTPQKDIESAYLALSAVDGVDGTMIDRVNKIKAIKKMSIDIIYEQIKYIHDCIHEVDESD